MTKLVLPNICLTFLPSSSLEKVKLNIISGRNVSNREQINFEMIVGILNVVSLR